MDRKTFLSLSTIVGAGALRQWPIIPNHLNPEPKPAIVLVHGAWHGGWCWKRVVAGLRGAGYEVFFPTLTGVGERVHLATPLVNLDTHITDVMNVIEAEELQDVVLVGHSYSGMVITGVADRMASRLRSLIYIDAFVPETGCSMIDYVAVERRSTMIKAGESTGYLNPLPASIFGLFDDADLEWVTRRMTAQPYATFSQKLNLKNGGGRHLPRTFVYCSSPPSGSFDQFAKRFRKDPDWQYYELKTGHNCMIIEPAEVTRVILQASHQPI